ncbi:MAG: nucleotidyltransferase domain-containing protein [Ginsengibacter sp.]
MAIEKINKFGLSEEATDWILQNIQIFPEIEEVIIFGSRDLDANKRGSDIDFAIKGTFSESDYPERLIHRFNEKLHLPYFHAVYDYSKITNPELRTHIDQTGKVLYTKKV